MSKCELDPNDRDDIVRKIMHNYGIPFYNEELAMYEQPDGSLTEEGDQPDVILPEGDDDE